MYILKFGGTTPAQAERIQQVNAINYNNKPMKKNSTSNLYQPYINIDDFYTNGSYATLNTATELALHHSTEIFD